MKRNKIIALGITLGLTLSTVLLGFFGLADIIQWVVSFPESLTYWTFNNRFALMSVGIISFLVSFIINHRYKIVSRWVIGAFFLLFSGLFISGFLAPSYIMFKSEHQNAKYIEHSQVKSDYLSGNDEVMVLVNNGDARAFPNKWIVHTHIAGGNIGGDELVMTYCGLSHVGQGYSSSIDGEDINLKVLTQLENNLVMFDANSQDPITQIYGEMNNSQRKLNSFPTTVMSYDSFRKLYPEGKVYYYQQKNIVDRVVYKMLENAIYAEGGQYDKSTEKLSFNTISYNDDRLHAKEQIYGISINGASVAFTKEYLINNGNVVTEIIGGQEVTIKYFEGYDFVHMYYGNDSEVDPYGYSGQQQLQAVPHHNRILWKVWTNFYRDTELRS